MPQNKRPPVILQVLPALRSGGVERGTVEIATSLAENGYKAIVASAGGPMVKALSHIGVTHVTLPLVSRKPWAIYQNINRLQAVIADFNVDIVHARSRAPAWSAYFAAQKSNVPFMTTFHGTYNATNRLKKSYNAIMTKGQRVIAISRHIAAHITHHYPMAASKIRLIYRGVNHAQFDLEKVADSRVIALANKWALPMDRPIIMLPGRLTRWKGGTLLIAALANLKAHDPRPFCCLLVGALPQKGTYLKTLLHTIAQAGLSESVKIIDGCDDMPAAYKLADIVVSASLEPEAFGRVAVEGLAMGRLVIAPAHGGALEQIIPGENGWLFAPNDAQDLAAKMTEARNLTAQARLSYLEAGLKTVRDNFSVRQMAEKTLAVYDELL